MTATTHAVYLIFTLDDLTLALPAANVVEIVWLPELTVTPGLSAYVAGVFDLRGRLIPVIDLNLRAGTQPQPYQLDHQVIVLEQVHGMVGLIAHDVQDVQHLGSSQIFPLDSYQDRDGVQRFGVGTAQLGTGLAYVIDPDLVTDPAWQGDWDDPEQADPAQPAYAFGVGATPALRQVWHERAVALAAQGEQDQDVDKISMAVIRLNSEIFGLDLALVQGIAQVGTVTPIPCCPAHVLGNMNLRGEIITLFDIRETVGLRSIQASGSDVTAANSKMVILEQDDVRVGIVVDDVLDVVDMPLSVITEAPFVTRSNINSYTIGTAPYGDCLLGLLDLGRILADGALVVEGEI